MGNGRVGQSERKIERAYIVLHIIEISSHYFEFNQINNFNLSCQASF